MALKPDVVKLFMYRLGFAIRETGQALERAGCSLQGIWSHDEPLTRHASLTSMRYHAPEVDKSAFVAPTSTVAADVQLGKNSSVWYSAIIRGDKFSVKIGDNVNIQDGSTVGSSVSKLTDPKPTFIGNNVSIGHNATVRGCTIDDNVLIGNSAMVLEDCKVKSGSIIAAGAVVEKGTTVPSGEVWAGNPAKKLRAVKPEEATYLKELPTIYAQLAAQHAKVASRLYEIQDVVAGGKPLPPASL